jgi:similar to stage IV sporulation protein
MLNRLSDFLCGWRTLSVPPEERTRTFDLMYRAGIPFTEEHPMPDGTITVRLRGKNGPGFRAYADREGSRYISGKEQGLPVIIAFLRHRPAIPLGLLLAAGWLFWSTRIIWDVRIEGAVKTDPEEIIALLDELGCGIGDYFPAIDFNDLHAKYAAAQRDIAWLSVYMNGTVAEVQVRELWRDERFRPPENTYANVFADADGIVEEVNVREGQACVKPGDLGRKGQVLISGVIVQKD